MEALQQAISQLGTTFKERMDNFEGELQKEASSTATSTSLGSLATDFAGFKKFTLNTLNMLQQQIQLIQQSVDHIEMHSRRKILLLHGVAEDKQEDVAAVVTKFLATRLKMDGFKSEQIRRCHRMGRFPTSSGKPRPILFRLCDESIRNNIWMAKSKLKGSGVTLSEFLTKNRHNIFMQARQRFGVSKCWTRNGTVFVLNSNNSTPHRINQLSDLDKIALPVDDGVQPAAKEKEGRAPSRQRRVVSKK